MIYYEKFHVNDEVHHVEVLETLSFDAVFDNKLFVVITYQNSKTYKVIGTYTDQNLAIREAINYSDYEKSNII